jgi:hypothetical protein
VIVADTNVVSYLLIEEPNTRKAQQDRELLAKCPDVACAMDDFARGERQAIRKSKPSYGRSRRRPK